MNWAELISHLQEKTLEQRIPFTGTFELTARCNLQCAMCYINLPAGNKEVQSKELSAETWIRLAQEAKKAGMLKILLTGGEVFIRPDFREIYEAIAQMGFLVQVYSNATLITSDIADWLGKMPPSQMGVSVYGASPETYEQVCGTKEAFHRAMKGIDHLVRVGIKPDIRMTIIRKNVHDFEKILEYADQHGLIFLKALSITKRRDEKTDGPEKERLSPEEFIEFIETKSDPNKVEILEPDQKIIEECELVGEMKTETTPLFCGAGRNSFWITWDGRMTFCGDIDVPFTYPLKDGFEQAFKELQTIVDAVPFCEDCRRCTLKYYCIQCPARLKSETGHFDQPSPYYCELAKQSRNWAIKSQQNKQRKKKE